MGKWATPVIPIHKVRKALRIKRTIWAKLFGIKMQDISAIEGSANTLRTSIRYPPEWLVDAVSEKFYVDKNYLIGRSRIPWKKKIDQINAMAKRNRIINGTPEEDKNFDCVNCKNNTSPEICAKCDIDIHSLYE